MNPNEVRHLLEAFAAPFVVASTETQRRRVVDHAIKEMTTLKPENLRRYEPIPDADRAELEGEYPTVAE